ncbi:hypothetical protein HQ531_03245 [bacterium]|nr:hypothetical protein [bacterium]
MPEKILPDSSNPEAGFGMSLIAIIIAVVMGLAASMYMRQISTQSHQYADFYAASQAHWTALSGTEFTLYKTEVGEADYGGPYNFYNSIIAIDTSESGDIGGPLEEFHYRVISKGSFGSMERYFRVQAKMSMKTVWGDVSVIEGQDTAEVRIYDGFKINDSLYIGQNVYVESDAVIGSPLNGTATHLYIPPGKNVTGKAPDATFTYGQHARGWLFSAGYSTTFVDSLLDITDAVTADGGNKFKGRETFSLDTLDLSIYADSTIFVNGVLILEGMYITGGSDEQPAIIVSNSNVTLRKKTSVITEVDDNIIIISGANLMLNDGTLFGVDQSAIPIIDRPNKHNEVFAYDELFIQDDVVAWGQGYAGVDLTLDGALHGLAYAPGNFRFTKATSYLEGAIFAHFLWGSSGPSRLDLGQMDLNHFFHEEYFATFDYGVLQNSLLEF